MEPGDDFNRADRGPLKAHTIKDGPHERNRRKAEESPWKRPSKKTIEYNPPLSPMELLMIPITQPRSAGKFRTLVVIGLTSKYVQPLPAKMATTTSRGNDTGVSDETARFNRKKPLEDTTQPTSSVNRGPTCCLRSKRSYRSPAMKELYAPKPLWAAPSTATSRWSSPCRFSRGAQSPYA